MRWEYKAVKLRAKGFLTQKVDETELDTMLNDLGRDAWELATAFEENKGIAGRDVVLIFKRPKER